MHIASAQAGLRQAPVTLTKCSLMCGPRTCYAPSMMASTEAEGCVSKRKRAHLLPYVRNRD